MNIVLSALARTKVRAMVRNHPGYGQFCLDRGLVATRNMTKPDLMAAIVQMNLEEEARAIAAKYDGAEADEDVVSELKSLADMAMERIAIEDAMDRDSADRMRELSDTVLSPLRPFLSPVILKDVETALLPIVEAATRPPVTIDRVVTLDENGAIVEPAVPAIPEAQRTGKAPLSQLFGIRGKNGKFEASVWNAADRPSVEPYYVVEPDLVHNFVSAMERSHYVWMAGPAGSGKTTIPMQVAARLGRPFVRCAMDRAVEPIDLFGTTGLRNGQTVWVDGILTRAIRRPGTIILIDEITLAPPGIAASLQTMLDERHLEIKATGERVPVANGVFFAAADNTAGFGDDSGLYHGTGQANVALVDRFPRLVKVSYLSETLETEALANRSPGVPIDACKILVSFVNSARNLPGFDARPLSLRRMVAFMGQVQDGYTPARAFEDTFLTRLPDTEREALSGHIKASFSSGAFEAAMSGKPLPGAPSSDPAQVRARNSFDVVDATS